MQQGVKMIFSKMRIEFMVAGYQLLGYRLSATGKETGNWKPETGAHKYQQDYAA